MARKRRRSQLVSLLGIVSGELNSYVEEVGLCLGRRATYAQIKRAARMLPGDSRTPGLVARTIAGDDVKDVASAIEADAETESGGAVILEGYSDLTDEQKEIVMTPADTPALVIDRKSVV